MFEWLLGDWRSVGFVALSTTLIYLSVVIRDGEALVASLRRAHMTEADLATVLRQHGVNDTPDAELVVLEPRGAFSVIPRSPVPGNQGADADQTATP